MTNKKYGDKTAKELDNYMKNYKIPKGKTRTGLVAPIYDMTRNYNTIRQIMKRSKEAEFMVQ